MLYELRHYDATSVRGLRAVVQRFDEYTIPIWDRHGIKPVGFWTVTIGCPGPRLTYLLAWDNLAQREERWNAFVADTEWRQILAETNARTGGSPIRTITSSILAPTPYSPQPLSDNQPSRLSGGVFELRAYSFHDAAHLIKWSEWVQDKGLPHLKKHHIHAVGFWTTIIGVMPRYTYMLNFENLAHREHAWASLLTDPDWVSLQEGVYDENGVSYIAGIDSCLMKGTHFSGWK